MDDEDEDQTAREAEAVGYHDGVKAGIEKERKRVVAFCIAEYKQWRETPEDASHELDLIAIGASGAAANLLAAVVLGNEVDD